METNENVKLKGTKIVTKVIIAIAVVVAILIGGYFGILKFMENQIEKKIDTVFSELKTGNFENIKEIVNFKELLGDSDVLEGLSDQLKDVDKLEKDDNVIFKELDYKIISSDVKFKNASVVLEVTNKNIGKAISNCMIKISQLIIKSLFVETYSQEELNNQIEEIINNEINSDSLEKVTNTVTIEMNKENDEWKLKTEPKIIVDAILPGLMDKMEELNNSFGIMDNSNDSNVTENDINDEIL